MANNKYINILEIMWRMFYFTFPIVNFPLSVAIFQHHQRMELTFHNAYVILELVPSTMIFWTDLSCWRKNYSNKTNLLLGWSHLYTNYTVVITIWLTVMKYPFLKWQCIFDYLRTCRCFLSSTRLLPDLTVYMSNTACVL